MGQRELYAKGGITKWYWDFRDRAVLQYTAKADSVLDIGCGEGITLERVVRQNPNRRIIGIDPEPGNIKNCGRLPALVGSVYRLPETNWDCCLLLDVIEHLSNPLSALQRIHRALAKNGILVLLFPNYVMFFLARLACLKFKEAFAESGHVESWNLRKMEKLLGGAGFSVDMTQRLPIGVLPLHYLIVARKK